MNQEIIDYVQSQKVCVIALEMMDGSPHASTVHYAYIDGRSVFVFETDREYRKAEALFGRTTSRASMVIGTNETDMKTFQLDGEVTVTADENLKELYLQQFPKKRDKANNANVVFFTFTPTWWRLTDWTRPEGKTISTSDGKVVVTPKK